MIIFVGQEKLNKFSLFPQIFVEYSQNIFIASIVYENMFMFDVERSGHDTCYWDAGQAGWAMYEWTRLGAWIKLVLVLTSSPAHLICPAQCSNPSTTPAHIAQSLLVILASDLVTVYHQVWCLSEVKCEIVTYLPLRFCPNCQQKCMI